MSARLAVAMTATIAALCAFATDANAAELKVISGPATAGVLAELAPQFKQGTGYILTKKGGVTGVLKELIENGEPFDVALIPAPLMDRFATEGKIAANTNVPFVRVGMGVAVQSGHAKLDTTTVAALKQTLLNARSITFVPTGEAANHLAEVLRSLGIAEQLKSRLRPQPDVPACIKSVADGEAELYVSLTNIIAAAKGIELAGAFPPELQHHLYINAGVSAAAKEPKGAAALISLLESRAAQAVIRSKGLEPVGQ